MDLAVRADLVGVVGRGVDPAGHRGLSRDRVSLISSIRLSGVTEGRRANRAISIHLSTVGMGRASNRLHRVSKHRRAGSLQRMCNLRMLTEILLGLRAGATRKFVKVGRV